MVIFSEIFGGNMAAKNAPVNEAYGDIQDTLNSVVKNSHRLLPKLTQITAADRERITEMARNYPPQEDITVAADVIEAMPNQLRAVTAMQTYFEKTRGNSNAPLTPVETSFAAMPWHTTAEFHRGLFAMQHILGVLNQTEQGQAFNTDNLDSAGKYDDIPGQIAIIINQSWDVQKFVKQHEEEIYKARTEYQEQQAAPASILQNANAAPQQANMHARG